MLRRLAMVIVAVGLAACAAGTGCPPVAPSIMPLPPQGRVVYHDFGNNGLPEADYWRAHFSSDEGVNAPFSAAKLVSSPSLTTDKEAAQAIQSHLQSFFLAYDICFANSYEHEKPQHSDSVIFIGRYLVNGSETSQGGYGQSNRAKDVAVVYAYRAADPHGYPANATDAYYEVARLAAHELGHHLGLEHSGRTGALPDPGDIMAIPNHSVKNEASFVAAALLEGDRKGQPQNAPAILLATLGPSAGRQCAVGVNGNSQADSDGDGVPDTSDGCPDDPNKSTPGNCGCGVPDTPICGHPPAPGAPSSPSPADGATGVPLDVDLDWADALGTKDYDVFFGTSNPPYHTGDYLGIATSSNWTTLPTLAPNTRYYWKVVAFNSDESEQTHGPIWSFTTSDGGGSLIDDFEDGVINTALWTTRGGNYAGGPGWGTVSEHDGSLVLECVDPARYGAGVSCAILKQVIVDTPIYFSFDLTITDDTMDGSYTPGFQFRVTGQETANAPNGVESPIANPYRISHNQQQQTNHVSGSYYFFLDSSTKEAQLYNADDNSLLGSASYAHFGALQPHIAFDAYSDAYNGSVSQAFLLTNLSK